jgi:NADPH:quinone reductase-like Zn-dependent oxidoreductase
VRPVIDRSFGFGDAPAAFDYLRDARHVGKVVIEQ